MTAILGIGLAVSLGGPLLLVLATKRFSFNSMLLPGRLSFWLLAAIALAIAIHGDGAWRLRIGLGPLEWSDFLDAIAAIVIMLVGAVVLQLLVKKLGFKSTAGSALQKKIFSLSAPYRLFIVITAAIAEEILYRGYAIGIGQQVWGNLTVAFVVSLLVFVGAHFTHGARALVTVFWISLIMSLLFVMTNNLLVCMIVHFVVDAVGVLMVPWVVARNRAQGTSQTTEAQQQV